MIPIDGIPNAEHEGHDIAGADDLDQRYAVAVAEVDDEIDTQWFSRADGARLGAFAARKQDLEIDVDMFPVQDPLTVIHEDL